MSILEDLANTRYDIPAFARLLGVNPHPGQERFWEALIQRDETRWRCAWMTLALSAGNRAGKTLALAIAILHHCVHKMGMRPPDPSVDKEIEQWLRAGFHWYHFGIQQEVGELVFVEIVNLLSGNHEAQQRKGCPLTDQLGQIADTSVKERGEYRWVRFDPKLGGAEIHFRTTNEKALGSLGKDMNGLSFDECGFETNLTFIVNEVLHFRRLSTGGPMLLVSTPSEGFTQFSDEWRRGDPSDPLSEPDHLSLRMSTRDNVGFGIDRRVFDRLVAGYPPELVPQNIDGYFIEGRQAFFNYEAVDKAFDAKLPEQVPPIPRHHYVHGIDPALEYDSTWSIVLDVEKGKGTGVLAQRKQGKQTMLTVVGMLQMAHTTYSSNDADCVTGCDTTGFGGKVFKDALGGIVGLRSVEFGGTRSRKIKLLTDLKGLLEQGRLRFPRSGAWLDLRRQLLGYRLDQDRKLETDGVMALAVAVKMLLARPEGGLTSSPFDFFGSEAEEPIEEGYKKAPETGMDKLLRLRRNVVTTRMAS